MMDEATFSALKENEWRQAAEPPQAPQQPRQPALKPPPLDVRAATPAAAGTAWAPPISCPSRLCGSPSRSGSCSFDPFEAPGGDDPPGCTPLCGPPQGRPALPPAVHRKPGGSGSQNGSPVAAARLQTLFSDRVQSCPPERPAARPGRRPVVRLRVKRSLNGAVAAAGGPAAARRSLDIGAGAAPPLQQLAGCSRKRFEEADLVSPPMPRKSSRTLLDDQQAADMMSRLALVGGGSSSLTGSCDAAAQQLMAWEAPQGAMGPSAAALTANLRSDSYP